MIGFIGLGKMGVPMAANLLQAGYPVCVYARQKTSAQRLLSLGATWANCPADLAACCDVIFTIIGGPDDVESLYLGDAGLIANARPNSVLIDMTTSSPDLAKTITHACMLQSLQFLDAPVTGGVNGAKAGTLTFMVGGNDTPLKQVMPYLKTMGSEVIHMGNVGAGQVAKSCNQIAVSGILLGTHEAINHAKSNGLSVEKLMQVLGSGTASSPLVKALLERLQNTGSEASFTVAHFIKDLQIALQNADLSGHELTTVKQCLKICEQVDGQSGLQILLK